MSGLLHENAWTIDSCEDVYVKVSPIEPFGVFRTAEQRLEYDRAIIRSANQIIEEVKRHVDQEGVELHRRSVRVCKFCFCEAEWDDGDAANAIEPGPACCDEAILAVKNLTKEEMAND